MVISYLIDGDLKIVIGGVFSLGYWFQIDLGVLVMLVGVWFIWDVFNLEGYLLQILLDGRQWQIVYIMVDLLGDVEMLYFVSWQVCYLWLVSLQCMFDWGVLIFEMEFLDSMFSVCFSGIDVVQVVVFWQGGGIVVILVGKGGFYMFEILLFCVQFMVGLVVDWVDGECGVVCLQVQDVQGCWQDFVYDVQVVNYWQSWLVVDMV